MKNFFRPLAIVAFALFSFTNLNAQADDKDDTHTLTVEIPELAILDIEGGGAVTLTATVPTEAGLPLDLTDTDNSLWLNYSSIIGSTTEPTRKVTVSVAGTNMPSGVNLKVVAAADAGNGGGNVGAPAAEVTLAATATEYDFITNVRSCYTGDGTSNGHQLTYSMTEDNGNYGDLDFDKDYTLTVTYTLSDN